MADLSGFRRYNQLLQEQQQAQQRQMVVPDVIQRAAQTSAYKQQTGQNTYVDQLRQDAGRRLLGTQNVTNYKGLDPVADADEAVSRYLYTLQESTRLGAKDPQGAAKNAYNRYLNETTARYQANGKSGAELRELIDASGYISPKEQNAQNAQKLEQKLIEMATAEKSGDAQQSMSGQEAMDYFSGMGLNYDYLRSNSAGTKGLADIYERLPELYRKFTEGGADALTKDERQTMDAVLGAWNYYEPQLLGQAGQRIAQQVRGLRYGDDETREYDADQNGLYIGYLRENPGDVEGLAELYERLPEIAERERLGQPLDHDEKMALQYAKWAENDEDLLNVASGQLAERTRGMGANSYTATAPGAYQGYLLNEYRKTPEGAAAWVEESVGTDDYEQARENQWFVDRQAHYADIRNREDFAELAKPEGAQNEREFMALMNNGIGTATSDIIIDTDYGPMVRGQIETSQLAGAAADMQTLINAMTDDELGMYAAVKRLEGTEAAKEYLKYIQYDLNKRVEEQNAAALYDLGNSGWAGGLAASALSIGTNLGRGFGALDVAGQQLRNQWGEYSPIDYHTSTSQWGTYTDAMRQGVQDQVDWSMNVLGQDVDLFDFLYGTGMSGLDSLAAGAVGVGAGGMGTKAAEYTTALVIGTQAAQSAMQEAKSSGASDSQAVLAGALAGAFETIFEKISIGAFFDDATGLGYGSFKDGVKTVLKEAGVNFSEELNTEIANILSEELVLGDRSPAAKEYQKYIDLGLSEDEARAKVAESLVWRAAEAGIGGGLMGAGFGALASARRNIVTGSYDKGTGKLFSNTARTAVWDIAKSMQGSEAERLVRQYSQEKASDRQAGEVFRAVMRQLPADMQGPLRGAVQNDLAQRVLSMTESSEFTEADQAAVAAASKLILGEDLTEQEMRAIAGNEATVQAVRSAMLGEREEARDARRQEEQNAEDEGWETMPMTEEEEAQRRDQAGEERQQRTNNAADAVQRLEGQESREAVDFSARQQGQRNGATMTDEDAEQMAVERRDQQGTERQQPTNNAADTLERLNGRENREAVNFSERQQGQRQGVTMTEEDAEQMETERRDQQGTERTVTQTAERIREEIRKDPLRGNAMEDATAIDAAAKLMLGKTLTEAEMRAVATNEAVIRAMKTALQDEKESRDRQRQAAEANAAERDTLRGDLSRSEEARQEAESERDTLRGELKESETARQAAENQRDSLNEQLMNTNERLQRTMDEVIDLRETIGEREEKIQAMEKNVEGLQNELDNLRASNTEYQGRMGEYNAQVAELENAIQQQNSQLEDLRNERDSMQERQRQLEAMAADLTEESDSLREQLGEVTGERDRLQGDLTESESARQQTAAELESTRNALTETETRAQNAETERDSLTAENEGLRGELTETEADLRQSEEARKAAEEELDAEKAEHDRLAGELREARAANEKAKAELNDTQEASAKAQAELRKAQEDLSKAQQARDNAQKSVDTLSARVQELEAESSRSRWAASRRAGELAAARDTLKNVTEQRDAAEAEISSLREQVSGLQKDVQAANAANKEATERYYEAVDSLKESQAAFDAVKTERDGLQEQLEYTEKTLQEKQEQAEKLRGDIAEKDAKIQQLEEDAQRDAQELDELKGQNAQYRGRAQDYENRIASLQNSINIANDIAERTRQERDDLQSSLAESERSIQRMASERDGLREQLGEVTGERDSLTAENAGLRETLNQSETARQASETERDNLNKENAGLRGDLASSEEARRMTAAELQQTKRDLASAETRLENAEKSQNTLRETIARLEEASRSNEQTAKEKEGQLAAARGLLAMMEEAANNAQSEIETLRGRLDEAQKGYLMEDQDEEALEAERREQQGTERQQRSNNAAAALGRLENREVRAAVDFASRQQGQRNGAAMTEAEAEQLTAMRRNQLGDNNQRLSAKETNETREMTTQELERILATRRDQLGQENGRYTRRETQPLASISTEDLAEIVAVRRHQNSGEDNRFNREAASIPAMTEDEEAQLAAERRDNQLGSNDQRFSKKETPATREITTEELEDILAARRNQNGTADGRYTRKESQEIASITTDELENILAARRNQNGGEDNRFNRETVSAPVMTEEEEEQMEAARRDQLGDEDRRFSNRETPATREITTEELEDILAARRDQNGDADGRYTRKETQALASISTEELEDILADRRNQNGEADGRYTRRETQALANISTVDLADILAARRNQNGGEDNRFNREAVPATENISTEELEDILAARRNQNGETDGRYTRRETATTQNISTEELADIIAARRDQNGAADGRYTRRETAATENITTEDLAEIIAARRNQNEGADERFTRTEEPAATANITTQELADIVAARRDQNGEADGRYTRKETAATQNITTEDLAEIVAARRNQNGGADNRFNRETAPAPAMTAEEESQMEAERRDQLTSEDERNGRAEEATPEELREYYNEPQSADERLRERVARRQVKTMEGLRRDESGAVTVVTGDGETDLHDTALTEDEQKLLDQGEELGGVETARDVLNAYRKGEKTNADRFLLSYRRAFNAGERGVPLSTVREALRGEMDASQTESAYRQGEAARERTRAEENELNRKMAADTGFRVAKPGEQGAGVRFASVKSIIKGGKAHTMLQVIDDVARKSGIQVRVHQSLKGENANYETGSNVVNIGLDAEDGALTKVASHEFYHFLQEWGGQTARDIQTRILDMLRNAPGYNLDQRVREIQEKYLDQKGQHLTEEQAKEELAADAALDFIGTEQNMRDMAREKPSLAQRIAEWAGNMAQKIRSVLERFGQHNQEVRTMLPLSDQLKVVQNRINEMLRAAGENYQRSQTGLNDTARQHVLAREYEGRMRDALTTRDRFGAAQRLLTGMYEETQEQTKEGRRSPFPKGEGVNRFAAALRDYVDPRKQKALQVALEEQGLNSDLTPEQMAALTYTARQIWQMETQTGQTVTLPALEEPETGENGEDVANRRAREFEQKYSPYPANEEAWIAAAREMAAISAEMGDERLTQKLSEIYERFEQRRRADANVRFSLRDDAGQDQQQDSDTFYNELRDTGSELYMHRLTSPQMETALERLRQLHSLTTQGGDYALIPKGTLEQSARKIAQAIRQETGTRMKLGDLTAELAEVARRLDSAATDEDVADAVRWAETAMRDVIAGMPEVRGELSDEEQRIQQIFRNQYIYLSDDQKAEIQGREGGLGFYRRNYGKMKIVQNPNSRNLRRDPNYWKKAGNVTSLVSLWEEELSHLDPVAFPADATEADMPYIVEAYLERLYNKTRRKPDIDRAMNGQGPQYASGMAMRAILQMYEEPGVLPTFVEGYRDSDAVQSMARQAARAREEASRAIEEARQHYAQQLEERIQGDKQRKEERAARDSVIHEIRRHTRVLSRMTMKGTDNQHIPEELRGAIEVFAHNMWGDRALFSGAEARALETKYSQMAADGALHDTAAASRYDPDILAKLNWLAENITDQTPLRSMNQEQLQQILDVVQNIRKMVDDANAIFFDGRRQDIDQAAASMLADLRAKKDAGMGKAALAARAMLYRELTPYYFGKRLGGTIETLVNELIGAQQEYAFTVRDAREFMTNVIQNRHVNDWIHDKNHLQFTTTAGDFIDLSRQQAMTLYAWWVRETTNRQQHAAHLLLGGFTYDTGDKNTAKLKKLGVDVSKSHVLSQEDAERIRSYLTDEQLEFVNDMVRYLSHEMAEKGNETSMRLYGWRKYGEKWYFPYTTDRNFRGKNTTDAAGTPERQLKNMGASHALTESARNPLKIRDFTDLWAEHVDEMAMYHAFAEKLDNLGRISNYVFDGGASLNPVTGMVDVTAPTSMKKEMERAYGREAVHYLEQLLRDVNGGVTSDERGFGGKMLSLFKKGSVAANLSVVLQQPSAFLRAMSLVSPRHFLAVLNPLKVAENFNGVKKRMYKNSGVAILKKMGRFDTNVGKSSGKWIMDGIKQETVTGRAMDLVDEVTGWGAEKADEITWCYMYAAIEHETEATTGLTRGTAEFDEAVARRFNAVMNATQVYDSTLAKSEWMRGTSFGDKMVTSFMSEPTLTANMLMDAALDLAEKKDGAGRHMARAAAVFWASALVNALLKSIATAFRRKKDEGRSYTEKYLTEVISNFSEDVSPAGIASMIPVARDIVSLVQGYDVERPDMSILSDLLEKLKKVSKNQDDPQAWVDAFLAAANLTGIPARNVYRDAEGIFRNILGGGAEPLSETDWETIKYTAADEQNFFLLFDLWDGRNAAYYDRMLEALEKGDQKQYDSLRQYVTGAKQVKDETADSGIRSALKGEVKEGTIETEAARRILEEIGTKDPFATLEQWNNGKLYTRFLQAVETGEDLQKVAKEYMDEGKSKETLGTQITNEFKDQYLQLYAGDPVAAANLKARILTGYEAIGYDRDKKSKDIDKWVTDPIKEELKGKVEAGTVSDQEAEKTLRDTFGMDAEDAYWTVVDWKNGDEKVYSDFLKAVETGTDLRKVAQDYLTHGKGKDVLGAQITSQFKPIYIELYKTDPVAAANLKARLLTGYEAIGYDRDKKAKDIDKWVK